MYSGTVSGSCCHHVIRDFLRQLYEDDDDDDDNNNNNNHNNRDFSGVCDLHYATHAFQVPRPIAMRVRTLLPLARNVSPDICC